MRPTPHRTPLLARLALTLASTALPGCGADPAPDARAQAVAAAHASIAADLTELTRAVTDLRAAAPTPDDDGWTAAADAAQVAQMRAAWKRARDAWERVEAVAAELYPDLDRSVDGHYPAVIPTTPDDDLFDGVGFTGLHAVERVLWADSVRPSVVQHESGLRGYAPAATPRSRAAALAFRDGLCGRLVTDAQRLERSFGDVTFDAAALYRAVNASVDEQVEKVDGAAEGEEESPYAQTTLRDMTANLEGGRRVFVALRPWLESRAGGAPVAIALGARFTELAGYYGAMGAEALPMVPSGYNPDMPSATDAMSAFGQLRARVLAEASPTAATSLVTQMNRAADALGIARLE